MHGPIALLQHINIFDAIALTNIIRVIHTNTGQITAIVVP